jgi:hypothetical protein
MVKLQPGGSYDLIEAGVYELEIESVTPEDPNPRFEDARPQLKFIFWASDPVWVSDSDAERAKVFSWTGQTYGPSSKLRPWLAVLMPDFNPDKDELDTDDLVGLTCRGVVTLKKNEAGKEQNRVTEVLPLEQRRRPAAVGAGSRRTPLKEDDIPF